MRLVLVVFRKELLDNLRDRRSLLSTLLYPLFGPLLIAAMFTYVANTQGKDRPLEVPVVGRDNAPQLMEFLVDQGVDLVSPPPDPQAAVAEGELELVLIVPPDFATEFRSGQPAPLELIVDGSRQDARASNRRLRTLLATYQSRLAALRLLARGVDPRLVQPLAIQEVDLATPQQRAANVLNILPMFVLLAAFIGGMYVATDTTAGERERGSLEPLLINPIPRGALVFGKWLATVAFATAAVTLTLVFTLVALHHVPLSDIGIRFDVGIGEALGILCAVVPLAFLAGSSQMLVATFARSFKEAQSYLSLLLFLPMAPGLILSLEPLQSSPWMMPIPILGQQMLMMDVLRGEATSMGAFVVAGASALVVSLVGLAVTARLFGRERIIFGR